MDKIEERFRELEIAARIYLELGGDDEEPERASVRRISVLEGSSARSHHKGAQPLLVVRKKAEVIDGDALIEEKKKRKKGRPRKAINVRATEDVRTWFRSHPGASIKSGDLISIMKAKTKEQKQSVYNALYGLLNRKEIRRDGEGNYAVAALLPPV